MGTRVMKAAVRRRPTSLGALTITDTAVPAVPENGVLIRVRASSDCSNPTVASADSPRPQDPPRYAFHRRMTYRLR